jgi:hypothetical protein
LHILKNVFKEWVMNKRYQNAFWEKYVRDTPVGDIATSARHVFNKDGGFNAIALYALTNAENIDTIPNTILETLRYAPDVVDPDRIVDPKLAMLVRSYLLEKGHVLADPHNLNDDAAVNLARDGRVPNAVLLDDLSPETKQVEVDNILIFRPAQRNHASAQSLLASIIEIPQTALGDTKHLDTYHVADFLDLYAVVRALNDRGRWIIDADDMWGDVDGTHDGNATTSPLNEATNIFRKLHGSDAAIKMATTALWYKSIVTGQLEPGIVDMNEVGIQIEEVKIAGAKERRFDFSGVDHPDLAFRDVRSILAYIIAKGGDDIVGTGFTDRDFERIDETRAMGGKTQLSMAMAEIVGVTTAEQHAVSKIDFPNTSPFADPKKMLLAMRELIESDFFNNADDSDKHGGTRQMANYVLLKFLHGGDDLMKGLMKEVFPTKFRNASPAMQSLFEGLHALDDVGTPKEPPVSAPKKPPRSRKAKKDNGSSPHQR